jgi:hypothetical protein
VALGTFSGNGNYQIDVDAAVTSQDLGLKRSYIYWRVMVNKGNTYGHSAWGNTGSNGNATSNVGTLWSNGNMEYNFQNGQYGGAFMIAEGNFFITHRDDGTQEYYVNGALNLANLGSASAGTGWRSLPRLAREPDAPTPLWVANITQTSMDYRFSGNYDGGSAVIEYQALYQEGNGPQISLGWENDGLVNMTGLKPATNYNFWSRGRNSIGWGPWSQIMSGRTLAGARVKQNGVWKEAIPYVRKSGSWKLAQPYSKINGVWRKGS